jgi:hypothetical protein
MRPTGPTNGAPARKSETCQTAGTYAEMSGCSFDPNRDYSCYQLPTVANGACPQGITPEQNAPCTFARCLVCNSQGGLPGGTYLDPAAPVLTGYCVCGYPDATGTLKWSCAPDTAWPCPANASCTPGGAPFGQPACPSGVAHAAACMPDVPFCYKACGPEGVGVKSETCQIGGNNAGTYAEMSGCVFDPSRDHSCYKIPTTANAVCPTGVTIQASTACDIPECTLCNSLGGVTGGNFADTTGAARPGYCLCQPPNAAGVRTWSCASDFMWPCPQATGC